MRRDSLPVDAAGLDEEQPALNSGGATAQAEKPFSRGRRIIYLLHPMVFLPLTGTTALLVPSITTVLALTGALTVVPFMFVYPGLLLLRLQKTGKGFMRPSRNFLGLKPWHRSVVGVGFVIGGLTVSVISLAGTISDIATNT